MSATIIIATYGDKERWDRISMRAVLSAEEQTMAPDQIIRIHGNTLHGARNEAAMAAKSEWLCFLDADDELEPSYLQEMINADGDLRYPVLQKVIDGISEEPQELAPLDILLGNFMLIGTLVRRKQFMRIGGFDDLPILEDWDLWIRCVRDGAVPKLVRGAIYRAHQNPGSRNNNRDLEYKTYNDIRSRYL